MEAALILATLAQRFHFELATDAPILPAPSMTLRPDRQGMLARSVASPSGPAAYATARGP